MPNGGVVGCRRLSKDGGEQPVCCAGSGKIKSLGVPDAFNLAQASYGPGAFAPLTEIAHCVKTGKGTVIDCSRPAGNPVYCTPPPECNIQCKSHSNAHLTAQQTQVRLPSSKFADSCHDAGKIVHTSSLGNVQNLHNTYKIQGEVRSARCSGVSGTQVKCL